MLNDWIESRKLTSWFVSRFDLHRLLLQENRETVCPVEVISLVFNYRSCDHSVANIAHKGTLVSMVTGRSAIISERLTSGVAVRVNRGFAVVTTVTALATRTTTLATKLNNMIAATVAMTTDAVAMVSNVTGVVAGTLVQGMVHEVGLPTFHG